MNAKDYQVVVISGGRGRGLVHRTRDEIPKCLLEVCNKRLIDYCLELYERNGFEDFVLLLGHLGEKVKEYVENSKYRGKVRYSVEKELLGKGGAMKYALDNGVIDRRKPCIVCYPDDVIVKQTLPTELIDYHERKGKLATVVYTPRVRLRYGSMIVDEEGLVKSFEEKAWFPINVNVGIYALNQKVYELVDELVDLSKKPVDFENTVVKELVKRNELAGFQIEPEAWLPFNDEKDYERGEAVLKSLSKNLF
jgi:NDP-sugar pyrophosphorylase family protein